MHASIVTPSQSVRIVPLADLSSREGVQRIFVANDKNRAQWIKIPLTAGQDLIDNVCAGKRVSGWTPVVLAEVTEQAAQAHAAGLPVSAPITLASLLDDMPTAPVGHALEVPGIGTAVVTGGTVTRPEVQLVAVRPTLTPTPVSLGSDYAPRADRGEHDDEGETRAKRDEETAAAVGLALPAAMFSLGTTLYKISDNVLAFARNNSSGIQLSQNHLRA